MDKKSRNRPKKSVKFADDPLDISDCSGELITSDLHDVLNMPVVDTPEVGVEEVVLNRRGTPARQRKRNRFYYDDDLITSDSQLRLTKQQNRSPTSASKKIKQEPVEVVEEITLHNENIQYGEDTLEFDTEEFEEYEEILPHSSTPSPTKRDALLMPPPPPPPRGGRQRTKSAEQSSYFGHPTAAQVAQAVTAMVNKPRRANSSGPSTSYDPFLTIKTEKGTKKHKEHKQHKEKHGKPRGSYKQRRRSSGEKLDFSNVVTIGQPIMDPLQPGIEAKLISQYEKYKKPKTQKEHRLAKRDSYSPPKVARRPSMNQTILPHSGGIILNIPGVETFHRGAACLIDKKTAHDISIRLRNLLKLPKAHKWVCYEWFYSNIDKVLFDGENDFQICLKESFPTLRASKLAHAEWTKIRRMMGKPRRCSQAFFDEEREELRRRRQKIRMIQQRKITDFNYKELPDEIPLQLVIGTKVTARLRKPQDGLFTGTIEAVDTSNNTYRITFDRPGLGTHSIPDYEVLSNDPPETVSTSSFALKIPRRSYGGSGGTQFKISSALADEMSGFPKSPFPVDGMLGGFPIRLLDMIVRLSKLLKAKREKILNIKELNVEAEKVISYGRIPNEDYRIRYSRCVLDLDSMNREMALYLEAIQQYCLEIAPDHGANQMIVPELVQEQCRQESLLIVDTYNAKHNRNLVHNRRVLTLIANLTSLVLQTKALAPGERNLYEVKSLKDTLKEIKASLDGQNVQLFQDRVEIPMNRIQAGLTLGLGHR